MAKRGKLYVFTGPSGTGKGTILSRVLEKDEKLFLSVSATTRKPREGEKHGVHYYFLGKQEFELSIANGEFLEYAQYVENYYGTLEAPVNEQMEKGNDVVLEIEVQGAMQIHEKRPDAVMIFVAPPSMDELKNRLNGRGTEDAEKIEKRLEVAKKELEYKDKFDYCIINDDLETAIGDLNAILRAERCKTVKK